MREDRRRGAMSSIDDLLSEAARVRLEILKVINRVTVRQTMSFQEFEFPYFLKPTIILILFRQHTCIIGANSGTSYTKSATHDNMVADVSHESAGLPESHSHTERKTRHYQARS